jgi:uncharacterized lipoprotein YajG
MKKQFLFLAGFSLLILASPLAAKAKKDNTVATITLPPQFLDKACKKDLWKNTTVRWEGVTDKREEAAVGRQTKKWGANITPVVLTADPTMAQSFNLALWNLFSSCGMTLLMEGKADRTLSVEIEDFYAGVDKNLLSGQATAKSQIKFFITHGTEVQSVTVGYEIDAKKIYDNDLRQLKKSLNELFLKTIEQVPQNSDLKNL